LLDPVEEAFDEVAGSIEVWTETDRFVAIAFRRDVGPCSLVDGEYSDPVRVVASIGKQHRSRLQARQELAGKPIVMDLTGRQREAEGQAIGINQRMNLARQAAPRPAHGLSSIPSDACTVLMYADNRGVDHLDSGIMGSGEVVL
jgi:hypothetical protein